MGCGMKNSLKFFLFLVLTISFFVSSLVNANETCGQWQKIPEYDRVCVFHSLDAVVFERKCEENICVRTCPSCLPKPNCSYERLCVPRSLPVVQSGCTEWLRVPNVSCKHPQRDFEDKWVRVCAEFKTEVFCTNDEAELGRIDSL